MRILIVPPANPAPVETRVVEDLADLLTSTRHVVGVVGNHPQLSHPAGPEIAEAFGPAVTIAFIALPGSSVSYGRVAGWVHGGPLSSLLPEQAVGYNAVLARTRVAERECVVAGCRSVLYAPWPRRSMSRRSVWERAVERAIWAPWPPEA